MTELHPSRIMHITASDPVLQSRIEALVRSTWWNDTSADPAQPVPLMPLAWAVATNPTILAAVTDAIDDGADPADAVTTISENDLTYVVATSLARLQTLAEPDPA